MASPGTLSKPQRDVCYKAKDLYWKCMDNNSDDINKCELARKEFEKSCPKKWMDYFMKRRQFNQFRQAQDATGYVRKTGS